MKYRKYYIAYGVSIFLLLSIWVGPIIFFDDKSTDEIILKNVENSVFEHVIPPKEEKKMWLILDNLNSILSVIVGGVNVYLISSHYRAKRRNEEPKENPKRIKRIFDLEPFD